MWESETDYRTIHSHYTSRQQVYFVDNDDDDDKGISRSRQTFKNLTKDALTVNSMTLDVGQGRQIFVPIASEELDIARFTFCQLCSTAKGAALQLVIDFIQYLLMMYVRLIILAKTEP